MKYNILINEYLKLYSESNNPLRGEWWIDDYGHATFADGNVGDRNHEGITLSSIVNTLLSEFNIEVDEPSSDIGDYSREIIEYISNVDYSYEEEYDETGDLLKIIKDYLIKHNNYNEEQIDIMYAVLKNKIDAIEYAMRYWGWIRVTGSIENWFETWEWNSKARNSICSFINNEVDSEEDFNINIEIKSTNRVLEDVPVSVLESGESLTSYLRR